MNTMHLGMVRRNSIALPLCFQLEIVRDRLLKFCDSANGRVGCWIKGAPCPRPPHLLCWCSYRSWSGIGCALGNPGWCGRSAASHGPDMRHLCLGLDQGAVRPPLFLEMCWPSCRRERVAACGSSRLRVGPQAGAVSHFGFV